MVMVVVSRPGGAGPGGTGAGWVRVGSGRWRILLLISPLHLYKSSLA